MSQSIRARQIVTKSNLQSGSAASVFRDGVHGVDWPGYLALVKTQGRFCALKPSAPTPRDPSHSEPKSKIKCLGGGVLPVPRNLPLVKASPTFSILLASEATVRINYVELSIHYFRHAFVISSSIPQTLDMVARRA